MVRALDHLLRWLLATLVGVLTLTVFLQVLVRFVFKVPLPWTEEVTRLAFVYSIFVGATIAVRERAHINVDVVLVALPPRVARAVRLLGTGLVAVFLLFVLLQGVAFVRQTGIQMTPVLQIPFRHLYLVIPSAAALMLLYLVLGAIDDVRQGRS